MQNQTDFYCCKNLCQTRSNLLLVYWYISHFNFLYNSCRATERERERKVTWQHHFFQIHMQRMIFLMLHYNVHTVPTRNFEAHRTSKYTELRSAHGTSKRTEVRSTRNFETHGTSKISRSSYVSYYT